MLVDGFDAVIRITQTVYWRGARLLPTYSVFVADSSIAENIAFGVPRQQVI